MAATARRAPAEERSVVQLLSDLWREGSTLLRDEAELAKAEISEKVTQAETALASLAAGAVILFAGFLFLLSAASAGLELMLAPEVAPWLAPLIVGLIVAIAGGVLLAAGRRRLSAERLAPERTLRSLRRDAELAKEHA